MTRYKEKAVRISVDLEILRERNVANGEKFAELQSKITQLVACCDEREDCNDSELILRHVQLQMRQLYQAEIENFVSGVRAEINKKQVEEYQFSDVVAGAPGGWMRPVSRNALPRSSIRDDVKGSGGNSTTSLWASAFDGAQASINLMKNRRFVEHMKIEHMCGEESESDHVVFCINGFMTQSADPLRNWSSWKPIIFDRQSCPDNSPGTARESSVVLYNVYWEAGDIEDWNHFCTNANNLLGQNSGFGSSTINSVSAISSLVSHFAGNPWHKAQNKANLIGIMLAQVLASQPAIIRNRKVSLFGHSLGAAVVFQALQELARIRQERNIEERIITNAVFFGGAFIPHISKLTTVANEIDSANGGKMINVFSTRDAVLSNLFWVSNMHGNSKVASGCAAIKEFDDKTIDGINVDVSDLIPPVITTQFGHSYGPFMKQIAQRVVSHLRSAGSE
uniref:Uncharacterized protein AlNc14C245G9543 n=1 Tax=Albugo laibachii Nc14 TaxID=890382 RepID=F0WT59_9STRA|nr:hypothetical protein PITG_12566 [Albugo laibachii Nc14]|eukprot:CCA24546.1 hypothetical protein PITG_12566 [Albugo laibachii Nc14]